MITISSNRKGIENIHYKRLFNKVKDLGYILGVKENDWL